MCDVYLASVPKARTYTELYPKERNDELEAVTNEAVKAEKYFVWRLLEFALRNSIGKRIEDISFTKLECGKWVCNDIFFSLSHSRSVLAIAISDTEVGIDIQSMNAPIASGLAERILTEDEISEYTSLPQNDKNPYLMKAWSIKESIFKAYGKASFYPSKISINEYECYTEFIDINDEKFCLSLVGKAPRIIETVEL